MFKGFLTIKIIDENANFSIRRLESQPTNSIADDSPIPVAIKC